MTHILLQIAVLMLASYGLNAGAFEIRGRVVDASTQEGIEGVDVSFVTSDGKTFDQVRTGPNGEFRKDVPAIHRQFRVAYKKTRGGPYGLGYDGYGRTAPVENNVALKDVDTIALRPRKVSLELPEKDAAVKDWLSYFLVTKEQAGLSEAIRYYSVDEESFNRSARLLQLESGSQGKLVTWTELAHARGGTPGRTIEEESVKTEGATSKPGRTNEEASVKTGGPTSKPGRTK